MAMNIGAAEEDDEDAIVAAINTTPLVDVMLVLLIIFMITIPVVIHTVPVNLPKEVNQPTRTKPENINLAVNQDGEMFWNEQRLADISALIERLATVAALSPQPEVHIRGDERGRYEYIDRVVAACQRSGITKISFITEPPPHGG
jgi:biopolymer transport protein ExbD